MLTFSFTSSYSKSFTRNLTSSFTYSYCCLPVHLVGRKEPRCLLAVGLVLHGAGLALVLFAHPVAMFASVILMAAANALMSNTAGVAYAQFFGRTHLGSIAGLGNALVVLGSAVGPFPFGLIRDRTGSFGGGACLPMLAAVMVMWKGRKPGQKPGRVGSGGSGGWMRRTGSSRRGGSGGKVAYSVVAVEGEEREDGEAGEERRGDGGTNG